MPRHNQGSGEGTIHLADGREVPRSAVEALDDLEGMWPGSSIPQARPAIVATVMEALEKNKTDVSS